MKEGFLPLSRKLFEHPLWREQREFSCAEAWIDLLRLARFEANSTKILIKGKMVEIHRGEYPASLRHLAKLWGWSKNRVDNFINMLISEGMISKRTAEGTNQTVITICKYGEYNFVSEVKGQEPGQSRDSGNPGFADIPEKSGTANGTVEGTVIGTALNGEKGCNTAEYENNSQKTGQQSGQLTGQSRDSDGTVTGQRRDKSNNINNINNIITPPYNPPEGENGREPFIKIVEIKDSLLKDELWKENACMQSGLSVDFLLMIPAQIDNFLSWIQSIGQESTILTLSDAKRRFIYWWKYTGLKEWKDGTNQKEGANRGYNSGSSSRAKPDYNEDFR